MNCEILTANLWTMGLNLAYALVAMMVGLASLKIIDRYIFPDINFIHEIKKGNTAAAILFAAALLFISLMLSSAVR